MPFTVNRYFNVPNTGDLPGAWGTTAVNANMSSIDGALGGSLTLSLGAATTITLTIGTSATFTPGSGPSQSENAQIKFTGNLSGIATIAFREPGYYIVHNACGSAAFFPIKLSPSSGTGLTVTAPPGRKQWIFFDGTDVDYVGMPEVGSALDLHQPGTALPLWMQHCTVVPYLIKDGSVYNSASYTALAQMLGSTFGGNGVTTFGVPDERSRVRVGIDVPSASTGTLAGRLTTAICGISGTTMGAVGGSQLMQSHAHTASVTDPGHIHNMIKGAAASAASISVGNPVSSCPADAGNAQCQSVTISVAAATTNISVSVNGTGSGSSQNVQPTIVSFLPLIKT